MKNTLERINKKVEPYSIQLLVIFVGLLAIYRNVDRFIDENDNFIGGMVVANGGDIYKDFISQHTPVMYYIAAIYRILGANSVPQYRMFFYLTLSLIWVLMYNRYSKIFGRITMILYPIGYIMMMASVSKFGHMVLSEQLQSQGIVILFLEFILFLKEGKIDRKVSIILSFAVFISFGVAFVSVFAIASIAFGVVAYEIVAFRSHKAGVLKNKPNILKKYREMIAIIAAPFVVLITIYIISGNIKNAYLGAYKINVTIYPKYLGQFTSNIVVSTLQLVDTYFNTFISRIGDLFTNTIYSIRVLLNAIINLLFIIYFHKRYSYYSLIIISLVFATGIRGYQEFHSLPYWGLTIIMAAILINDAIEVRIKEGRSIGHMNQLIFAFLLLVIISPYFSKFSSIMISRADLGIVAPEGSYEYVIHKLTSKEDRLFVNTLDNTLYISTNRLPATRDACGGITPWTYEMFGSTVIPDLNTYKPKIAIFKEGYDVWGYKNTTTQPEVVNYVKNNYTQLNIYNLDSLYIRNDYYSDAIHILNTK